jgi:hypothetical protein
MMETDFQAYEKYRLKMNLRAAMKDFWNQYPWEWFASFCFGTNEVSSASAERALKRWRIKLLKEEAIQIAYVGVLNHWMVSHLHLLLFGRSKSRSPIERTLLSLDPKKWQNKWPESARIKEFGSLGQLGYIVDQNMSEGWFELVKPYGKRHLEKHKLI